MAGLIMATLYHTDILVHNLLGDGQSRTYFMTVEDIWMLIKRYYQLPVDTFILPSGYNKEISNHIELHAAGRTDFGTFMASQLSFQNSQPLPDGSKYLFLSHTWYTDLYNGNRSEPWSYAIAALLFLQSLPSNVFVWADFLQNANGAALTSQLFHIVDNASGVHLFITGSEDEYKYFNSAWCMCERLCDRNRGVHQHVFDAVRAAYDGGSVFPMEFVRLEEGIVQNYLRSPRGQVFLMNFYRCYDMNDWWKIFEALNRRYEIPEESRINLGNPPAVGYDPTKWNPSNPNNALPLSIFYADMDVDFGTIQRDMIRIGLPHAVGQYKPPSISANPHKIKAQWSDDAGWVLARHPSHVRYAACVLEFHVVTTVK